MDALRETYWKLPKKPNEPGEMTRERFEREQIIPRWTQHVRENWRSNWPSEVDLLVSLVGFSPNTTLYCYQALRPDSLLLVHTKESTPSVDIIGAAVDLPASKFHRVSVDGAADALSIYKVVHELLEIRDEGAGAAIFDVTGGTAVMSAAAALAAWQLDLPLCYLESERPEGEVIPGSQRLCVLESPSALLGVDLAKDAHRLLAEGSFRAASMAAAELEGRGRMAHRGRFLKRLARLYEVWSALDLEGITEAAAELEVERAFWPSFLSGEEQERLDEQLKFALRVAKRDPVAQLENHFVLGEHYRAQGRHEFAAMLYYRAMEGAFVQRLERIAPDLFEGERFVRDRVPKEVLARFKAVATELQGKSNYDSHELHARLGFLDSAVLLYAYDDALLSKGEVNDIEGLGHLRTLADVRNRSPLAHGSQPVGEKDVWVLCQKSLGFLRALERLDAPERLDDTRAKCFDVRYRRLAFLKPTEP